MRLPEFLTELSPVRETLAALEQGENAMAEAVAEKNGQVCVETATGGLTLWERSKRRLRGNSDLLTCRKTRFKRPKSDLVTCGTMRLILR